MIKRILPILFILFGFSNNANAQLGLTHDLGVVFGPVMFKSDYGARNDYKTNIKNNGFGAGIVHYLTFSYRTTNNRFLSEHFRIRSEVSYNKNDFKHYGKYVDNPSNSFPTQQLRAMSGSTSMVNLGTQMEFVPLNIHDFEKRYGSFSPYVSLGAQISFYNTKAKSEFGELGTPLTTFYKYLTPSDGRPYGFSNESKSVLSVVSSVGTRYKLAPLQDLVLDFRFQYFNSDWVDGLNPNRTVYKENKANDWLVWVNVGYIYYLND
jgi:hypothetical protein